MVGVPAVDWHQRLWLLFSTFFKKNFHPVCSLCVIYFSHRRRIRMKKLILRKITGEPKNLRVATFLDLDSQNGAPKRQFWILQLLQALRDSITYIKNCSQCFIDVNRVFIFSLRNLSLSDNFYNVKTVFCQAQFKLASSVQVQLRTEIDLKITETHPTHPPTRPTYPGQVYCKYPGS